MNFGIVTLSYRLEEIQTLVRAAEHLGFDGFWLGETNADPFLALTLAAQHSVRMTIGSAIAVAFPRSPTTLAHIAHDLTAFSGGRFVLGLGTQVRAHNERRFGVAWHKPVQKMAEYIRAIRAVMETWQTGAPLDVRGDFFRLDLMPPFFSPAAHQYSRTPIYIAAVNGRMLRLAGELCDGVFVHAFHTIAYLRQVVVPNIEAGLSASGRERGALSVNTAVFAIPTDDPAFAARAEAHARQQIAFYMSTPAYRVVTDLHGWGDIQYRLSRYARIGAWDRMAEILPEELVRDMTVRASWADLPHAIAAKYGDLVDGISYYLPFVPGEADSGWQASIAGFRSLASRSG